MSLVSLLPEVLADALSRTDGDTIQNLLCSCRSICDYVRSIRHLIRLENQMAKFVQSLPLIRGHQNGAQEHNVHVFDTSAEEHLITEQHGLHKRGAVRLYGRGAQYKSILCPVDAKNIRLSVGGMSILNLNESLLRITGHEGYVDLMSLMRFLPELLFHEIRIDYDVGEKSLTLFTSHSPMKLIQDVTWKIFQIEEVCSAESNGALSVKCKCYSNHISLGHIVRVQKEQQLVTDCVKTFSMTFDNHVPCSIPAPHCKVQNMPANMINCPLDLRDCYYIQMSERVNCSRVDNFVLDIHFNEPSDMHVTIYNVHTNYARAMLGMIGLRYSN